MTRTASPANSTTSLGTTSLGNPSTSSGAPERSDTRSSPVGVRPPVPRASGASALVGTVALAALAGTVGLGLFATPPDKVQGELVRLIYIHPALAWVSYLAFGVTALASVAYLWRRTRAPRFDQLAASSAEVGVVFTALTLLTGAIWGRPTWGVWWTWDARLTTTALMLALFLGYLALRRVPSDPDVRAKRSAIVALVAVADIPIVHFSVEWWRTLHQGRTLAQLEPSIEGQQLVTMLLGIVAFTLLYAWLTMQRTQLTRLEDRLEGEDLDVALAERRAEAEGVARVPAAAGAAVGRVR